MNQRNLKANCRADVVDLARAIATTPERLLPAVLAEVYFLGLMLPRELWLAPFFWFVRKARGRAGMHRFFALLHRRHPEITRQWIADTARHITEGHDTEDDDSIGGWSQREIDALQSRLSFSALGFAPTQSERH